MKITEVHFVNASNPDVERGLLGWVSCTINDTLRLDGVTLRKTRRGRHTLSFPAKHSVTGVQFFYIRPLDNAARQTIEQQVFQALGLEVNTVP